MAGEQSVLGTGRTGGRDATTGVIPGRFALAVGMPNLPSPRGWKWTPLSDVAQLESGHTPSRKHPEYWDGDVPWIGIKDAVENHGRTVFDTYQHVTEIGLANSSARLLPATTVCLSRTASVGHVVVMGRPMATSQDFVNWICGPKLDPQFLKYVLLAENEALWRFASGTTHQTIYYPEAKALHVCLPPIQVQRTICHILGTLDDKIELNRRMNETLETMARAIFKSWFVDFDPVRAKAEGRAHGLPKAIANLFPNCFEDSESGRIPNGWAIRPLGDLIELKRGHDLPERERRVGPIPIYSSSGLTGYHDAAKAKAPGVVTGRYGTIGQVFFVEEDFWPLNTTLYVNDFKGSTPQFVFHLLRTIDFQSFVDKAAVPGINRNHVHEAKVIAPPAAVQQRFSELLEPLSRRQRSNSRESAVLTAIRDALLPKLLSGTLMVKNAARLLKETVQWPTSN
jgi:type I restriction enzyme S subunit